jgi:hypothetical protein
MSRLTPLSVTVPCSLSAWQCLVVLLFSARFIFFSVPLTGVSISLACYIASIALSRLNS